MLGAVHQGPLAALRTSGQNAGQLSGVSKGRRNALLPWVNMHPGYIDFLLPLS